MSSMISSISSSSVVPGIASCFPSSLALGDALPRYVFLRHVLRNKIIVRRSRFVERISAAIHDRQLSAKIVVADVCQRYPFECGGTPRVAFHDSSPAPQTPDKIREEKPLRQNSNEGGEGEECWHAHFA